MLWCFNVDRDLFINSYMHRICVILSVTGGQAKQKRVILYNTFNVFKQYHCFRFCHIEIITERWSGFLNKLFKAAQFNTTLQVNSTQHHKTHWSQMAGNSFYQSTNSSDKWTGSTSLFYTLLMLLLALSDRDTVVFIIIVWRCFFTNQCFPQGCKWGQKKPSNKSESLYRMTKENKLINK